MPSRRPSHSAWVFPLDLGALYRCALLISGTQAATARHPPFASRVPALPGPCPQRPHTHQLPPCSLPIPLLRYPHPPRPSPPAPRSYLYFILLNSSTKGPYYPHYLPDSWHWTDAFLTPFKDRVHAVAASLVCLPIVDAGACVGVREMRGIRARRQGVTDPGVRRCRVLVVCREMRRNGCCYASGHGRRCVGESCVASGVWRRVRHCCRPIRALVRSGAAALCVLAGICPLLMWMGARVGSPVGSAPRRNSVTRASRRHA